MRMRLSNEAVTSCKAMAMVVLCGAIVLLAAAARCRDMLHQVPACSEKASACSGVCTALCTYENICPRFLQLPAIGLGISRRPWSARHKPECHQQNPPQQGQPQGPGRGSRNESVKRWRLPCREQQRSNNANAAAHYCMPYRCTTTRYAYPPIPYPQTRSTAPKATAYPSLTSASAATSPPSPPPNVTAPQSTAFYSAA